MDIKEEFEKYIRARNNLHTLFGEFEFWWNVIDETESPWYRDGSEFNYQDEDKEWYSVEMYGNCTRSVDGYTIVVADNCSGDRDMYMFKDSNITDKRDEW